MSLASLASTLVMFYSWVLFVYVMLSWFPGSPVVNDVRAALAAICEPYLGLFRRMIPPMGMMDISPIVGFLFLSWVIRPVLVQLFTMLGL